jgi:hypothetical protein
LRVACRIVLAALAFVGALALLAGGILLLLGPGDPFDKIRVVAIVSNSSGTEAAVVYSHHIADFSADVLAVALVRPPFPAVGSQKRPGSDILVITQFDIPNCRVSQSNANTVAADCGSIAIAWRGHVVDVCPTNGAKLVRFDAQPFGYDAEHVTLCKGSAR